MASIEHNNTSMRQFIAVCSAVDYPAARDMMDGPITLSLKAFTAEGDRVAVETESDARTGSGRIYNNHCHFLFELRDSRTLRVREYFDTMQADAVLCRP